MNLTNPQSLNRYAYVSNSPLNAVDPLGLVCSAAVGDKYDTACNNANYGGGGGSGAGLLGGIYLVTWTYYQTIPPEVGIEETPNGPIAYPLDNGDGYYLPSLTLLGSVPGEATSTGELVQIPLLTRKKLTPDQCKAAQTLLNREQKHGTTVAAWQSAIGFGDNTVQPFNSSVPGQAYTTTAAGVVKVDWFTDLRLTTLVPGPQWPAYILGKFVWTGVRLGSGAPITNWRPFQDPVELHTVNLAVAGYGFRNLFTPQFMKENCGP